MRRKSVFFKAGILLLSLLLLPGMLGCGAISNLTTPVVTEDEVFHTLDEISAEYGGSRNVTVEQIPNGMRAVGTERTAMLTVGANSFTLGPEPENSEFRASILGFKMDRHTGHIILFVKVDLGTNSSILAWIPNPEQGVFPYQFDPDECRLLPGAPTSENVSIRINPAVGYTEVAGLRFSEEVTLNVWENGIVELDRENVTASDINGQQWISKRVRLGEETTILLVRK